MLSRRHKHHALKEVIRRLCARGHLPVARGHRNPDRENQRATRWPSSTHPRASLCSSVGFHPKRTHTHTHTVASKQEPLAPTEQTPVNAPIPRNAPTSDPVPSPRVPRPRPTRIRKATLACAKHACFSFFFHHLVYEATTTSGSSSASLLRQAMASGLCFAARRCVCWGSRSRAWLSRRGVVLERRRERV